MIGNLTDRLEILKPQRQADGGGGYAIVYASLGTVAASPSLMGAARDDAAGQPVRRRRQRFLIRQRTDMVYEMMLGHAGRRYRITDMREEGVAAGLLAITGEEVPQ